MHKFEPGDRVAVPASVARGAFPGEFLVTLSTLAGAISGFVREKDFAGEESVLAVVQESSPRALTVQLFGSYFTTNGLAEFAPEWARQNIKAIA